MRGRGRISGNRLVLCFTKTRLGTLFIGRFLCKFRAFPPVARRVHPGTPPGVLRGDRAAGPACERRAAAASWQVDLHAAKFAALWILD